MNYWIFTSTRYHHSSPINPIRWARLDTISLKKCISSRIKNSQSKNSFNIANLLRRQISIKKCNLPQMANENIKSLKSHVNRIFWNSPKKCNSCRTVFAEPYSYRSQHFLRPQSSHFPLLSFVGMNLLSKIQVIAGHCFSKRTDREPSSRSNSIGL